MKISPVASATNTIGAVEGGMPQPPNIRAVKMNTNATPGRLEAQIEALPPAQVAISDTSDQANAVPEVTEALSPQYAALAKQRRALQVKEREIADREKALSAQPLTQDGMIPKDRLKADPLSVLLEAGVTFDQLAEAITAQKSAPLDIEALKAEMNAGFDKKLTEREAQAEQHVLAEMKRDATLLVATGDDFEMVRETKSIPDVMKLIERVYREKGEVLDVRDALKLVEDELISESLKIAGLKKVQSRLTPAEVAPPAAPQRRPMTLTNRDTASVPMSAKARALAAFHGNLKK